MEALGRKTWCEAAYELVVFEGARALATSLNDAPHPRAEALARGLIERAITPVDSASTTPR
jgi:hypothetical protein